MSSIDEQQTKFKPCHVHNHLSGTDLTSAKIVFRDNAGGVNDVKHRKLVSSREANRLTAHSISEFS